MSFLRPAASGEPLQAGAGGVAGAADGRAPGRGPGVAVQFADGRSVSILDQPTGEAPDPDRLMISSGPGTGGGVDGWSFDMEYRVRPLPLPGPLAFVCEWPGRGIPASRMEVDGGAIRAAADAAVTLWPDDPYCGDDC